MFGQTLREFCCFLEKRVIFPLEEKLSQIDFSKHTLFQLVVEIEALHSETEKALTAIVHLATQVRKRKRIRNAVVVDSLGKVKNSVLFSESYCKAIAVYAAKLVDCFRGKVPEEETSTEDFFLKIRKCHKELTDFSFWKNVLRVDSQELPAVFTGVADQLVCAVKLVLFVRQNCGKETVERFEQLLDSYVFTEPFAFAQFVYKIYKEINTLFVDFVLNKLHFRKFLTELFFSLLCGNFEDFDKNKLKWPYSAFFKSSLRKDLVEISEFISKHNKKVSELNSVFYNLKNNFHNKIQITNFFLNYSAFMLKFSDYLKFDALFRHLELLKEAMLNANSIDVFFFELEKSVALLGRDSFGKTKRISKYLDEIYTKSLVLRNSNSVEEKEFQNASKNILKIQEKWKGEMKTIATASKAKISIDLFLKRMCYFN